MKAQVTIYMSLVAAAWLQHGVAHACSCAAHLYNQGVLLPRPMQSVPRNALFWLVDYGGDPFLRDPDGNPVEFDVHSIHLSNPTTLEGGQLLVLQPRSMLEAGSNYTVGLLASDADPVVFEVEDSIDEEPPPPPQVVDTEALVGDGSDSCGEYQGVSIDLTAEELTFVTLDDSDPLALDAEESSAFDLARAEPWGTGFSYGGACSQWPGAGELSLHLTSVDIAGNASSAEQPTAITRPPPASSGSSSCSIGLGTVRQTTASLWLALGGLLALRRRRRTRAQRT